MQPNEKQSIIKCSIFSTTFKILQQHNSSCPWSRITQTNYMHQ